MRLKLTTLYFVLALLLSPALKAEEASVGESIVKERYSSVLDITELTLKNGMKVILKPTKFEKNEVFIQFLAPGGYATLDKYSRTSARVAARAALESGLGGYSSDQLTSLQYRESVEVKPQIDKFYRTINGSCRPESMKTALTIVKMIFENHEINNSALKKVVEWERKNFENTHHGEEPTLNELYYVLNTQNSRGFRPASVGELNNIDFKLAQAIYNHSFSQPSEFIGTIVGNFDLKETKQLLGELLGELSNKEKFDWNKGVKAPKFPSGINRRVVSIGRGCSEDDVATWITIPINKALDQKTFSDLQIATKIMESRLREVGTFVSCQNHCLDVFYELPMFPYLNPVWVNIRFHCSKEQVPVMEKAIIKEIARLQAEGPKKSEIEKVLKLFVDSNAFWKRYNSFWHSNLINCYTWGWDPQKLGCICDGDEKELSATKVQQLFNECFSLDNYTVINAYPKHY